MSLVSRVDDPNALYDNNPYVVSTDEEGHQAFVFPRGMAAFALKYDADVVHIFDDSVVYYHGTDKVWKQLEDVTSSPVRQLSSVPRGKPTSTPSTVDTPP